MSSTVTTEQFSLRWNNFHSNITSGFHELLQLAEMVDVTLAVDGHFLQAHKVVLSICSPYFKQMFKENPCKHPIVILKDVGHENMKDILQFMYMGEVSVLRENLSSFLRTAEVLQVKGLTGEDSNEEPCPPKKDEIPEDDNEIYNQLIETTTDDLSYPENTPPPPQTSPLPLNCSKKHSKLLSPSNPKKMKTESSDIPKPIDYKSCDFNTNTLARGDNNDNDEAKDYSKSGASAWTSQSQMELPSGSCNLEQSNTEQDSTLYPTDAKGHVFCPYCCRKFVNRYNLKVHIRDKHESKSTDLDCQVCGKTMRNQSCLRVHLYHHRKQQMEAAGIVGNVS
ncbi:unnamed protein product [Ceutorhynchus assimilis]|uniref:Uncharacterized protein n=1 Tax=Ceutorhynchus assimilis TaxID=467358 RepID=A0A9N9QP42_9CUCU|nr:unnamed protein product [Ceutorhynchus assimilis]